MGRPGTAVWPEAVVPTPAPPHDRLFAPAYPGLSPRMLVRAGGGGPRPMPFDDPRTRYFYLARNGIYALARLWGMENCEVLFPAYFHGVELEALLRAGVRLRFYPVHEGMRVFPEDVISRIGPYTRAIYLIHYLGFPGPVADLADAARERGLLLIEDCALALLSRFRGRPLGSWGGAAIFCLYKTLPVPNGGAVLLRQGDAEALIEGDPPSRTSTLSAVGGLLDRHLQLRGSRLTRGLLSSARAVGKRVRISTGRRPVAVGTNHFEASSARFAMSGLCHRIVAGQDWPAIVSARRQNYLRLRDQVGDLAPAVFPLLPEGVCPLSYPLLVRDKPAMVERLRAHGVEAVNFWFLPHPAGPREPHPAVDALRRTVLELPCHQDLTPEAVDRVARVARKVLAN